MSKSKLHKMDKNFAPNCSLYLNAPKTVSHLKEIWKSSTFHQHNEIVKNFKYGFLISILISVYRAKFTVDLKKQQFGNVSFEKKLYTPTETNYRQSL